MASSYQRVFHSRSDRAWAMVVAVATLGMYVFTLRPDVGGFEDAPKFQFVGYVLGTAHQPGYPLYVLLTHLFAKLPIGTIAYRVNLFSAVMAAIACVGSFVLARQLGASNVPASAAALALAAGARFWRYAVVAEVYSLAAALVVWMTVALVAWSRSGRVAWLLAACALFAAGFGNHLTIVGVLPAAVLYVVGHNRSVLTVRVMSVAVLIGLLGAAQYGFVVLRTIQRAPYLDAHATSLSELRGVLTGSDFKEARFQYGVRELVQQRVPAVARAVGSELGVVASLVLAVGLVEALRRRRGTFALVIGAAAGMLAIVLNMNGDDTGFITPTLVLLWPVAAFGVQAIVATVARTGRQAAALAAAGAFLMPAAAVASNFEQANQRHQTDDSKAFRAFYAQLPPRAAVVSEDYWTDMMVLYLQLTGEVSPDPHATLVPATADAVRAAAAEGRPIFAFHNAATWLGAFGLRFTPIEVQGPSLTDWLRDLPRGTIVAMAAAGQPLPLEVIPTRARAKDLSAQRRRSFGAALWGVDEREIERDEGESSTRLRARTASTWLRNSPPRRHLDVHADDRGASILMDGDGIVQVDRGIVVAAVRPDGRWYSSLRYQPGSPLRVAHEIRVYGFERAKPCVELGRGATDVSAILQEGGWLTTIADMGTAVIDLAVAADAPLALRHRSIEGDGRADLNRVDDGHFRLTVDRTGWRRPVFSLAVGGPIRAASATLQHGGAVETLLVCAMTAPPLLVGDASTAEILPQVDSTFGSGWHQAERAGSTSFRWSERRSTLVLPLPSRMPVELRLTMKAAGAAGAAVSAAANGHAVGVCALQPVEETMCRYSIPSDAVHAGLNYVTLTADRFVVPANTGSNTDRRELAFSIRGGEVRVVR